MTTMIALRDGIAKRARPGSRKQPPLREAGLRVLARSTRESGSHGGADNNRDNDVLDPLHKGKSMP